MAVIHNDCDGLFGECIYFGDKIGVSAVNAITNTARVTGCTRFRAGKKGSLHRTERVFQANQSSLFEQAHKVCGQIIEAPSIIQTGFLGHESSLFHHASQAAKPSITVYPVIETSSPGRQEPSIPPGVQGFWESTKYRLHLRNEVSQQGLMFAGNRLRPVRESTYPAPG